jgi:hypothetical protein
VCCCMLDCFGYVVLCADTVNEQWTNSEMGLVGMLEVCRLRKCVGGWEIGVVSDEPVWIYRTQTAVYSVQCRGRLRLLGARNPNRLNVLHGYVDLYETVVVPQCIQKNIQIGCSSVSSPPRGVKVVSRMHVHCHFMILAVLHRCVLSPVKVSLLVRNRCFSGFTDLGYDC